MQVVQEYTLVQLMQVVAVGVQALLVVTDPEALVVLAVLDMLVL
jgi:hypothetical protein